jgi:tetratricopeptide (TPR) repeat protein
MAAFPAAAGERFIGREHELHELHERLARARAGRGGLVLLVGEPGIGKTRTAEELAARGDLPERCVLWGRCPEQEGAPAFWPWVQALRGHAARAEPDHLREDLGSAALDVARVVPAIRERLPHLAAPDSHDPAEARFRVFDAIAEWLRRAAARDPLLVILDDLHWADQDSLLLLEHVAREARTSRLLLLGTYREAEMRRREGRLGPLARAGERVVLHGLERPDVEAFLRASAVVPSPAMVQDLLHTSDGNPFFLGELVRVLKVSVLTGHPAASGPRELPHEVREAVRRHLEPLPHEHRRLLAIAAALGREFDLRPWRLACELEPERLLERLAVVVEAGIVRPVSDTPGRYRFAHALIRETLYADLPVSERAGLHRRIARALEAAHADSQDAPVAAIAHHYYQAAPLGEGAKAIEYALRAGERATELLAHHEAVEHLERALAALSFLAPDYDLEQRVLLDLAAARWRAGDLPRTRELYERAGRQARARGDAFGLARAALALASASPELGAPNVALIGLLEDALRALGEGENPLRTAVLSRLSSALYFARDTVRRDALSVDALAAARRTPDNPWVLASALLGRHLVLWGPDGSIAERLAIAEEIAALPDLELHLWFEGQMWLIIDLLEAGHMPAADREIEAFARRCEAVRIPARLWQATLFRATRAIIAARFAAAVALAAEALALRQEGLGSLPGQFYAAQLFVPFREAGRLAELAEPYAALAGMYAALPIWRVGLALVHAECGREADARRVLDEVAASDFTDLPRDGNFLASVAQLAELTALLHDAPRARLLAPLLAPYAGRHVIVGLGAGSLGSAARACGLLAATAGDVDAAVQHLDEALAANVRLGARGWAARTQLDLARVLAARGCPGDGERAAALRAEAGREAAALGMTRLAAAADELAADATPRTRAQEPEAGAPVSPASIPEPVPFKREGEYWTIGQGSFRLRDTKGLAYLATLLRHPGREFHVLDLVTGGAADAGVGVAEVAGADLAPTDGGDAGDVLDPQARAAYRRRLEDLRSELEEAESFNDRHRASELRAELDMLAGELARGVGLGGRSRKAASHAERARLNVTRAIGAVLKKITAQDRVLGRHLEASVRTGTFCSYAPYDAVSWDL